MHEAPAVNLTAPEPTPAPAPAPAPLHHAPQARAYGCAYHALYALTGRRSWLGGPFVNDLSPQRFTLHAAHYGTHFVPLFVDNMNPERTTDARWWQGARAAVREYGEAVRLFVGYPTEHPELAHAAALYLPADADTVTISDSARDSLEVLPFAAFARSAYAQAQRVLLMLPSAYANDYPPIPAARTYAAHGVDPSRRPAPQE